VPADCVKTTPGREFHVDLALFVDAFANSVDISSSNSSPQPSKPAPNVPTHTGADPPSSDIPNDEGKTASSRSAKKLMKSTMGILRICEKAPLEKQLKAVLKQKARTGRGGYGNPGKMILKQLKCSCKCHPRVLALIR
jgi:hypothetical protein